MQQFWIVLELSAPADLRETYFRVLKRSLLKAQEYLANAHNVLPYARKMLDKVTKAMNDPLPMPSDQVIESRLSLLLDRLRNKGVDLRVGIWSGNHVAEAAVHPGSRRVFINPQVSTVWGWLMLALGFLVVVAPETPLTFHVWCFPLQTSEAVSYGIT